MKRFHVHVHVQDLQASIAFYSKLFAAAPSRVETDYAKWMLEDPRINFAISSRGGQPGLDHLGFQTDTDDELAELKARAQAADMALLDEGETTCCYARSDKYWLTDPDGLAWEQFRTLDQIPTFSQARADDVASVSACCAPASAVAAAATAATPSDPAVSVVAGNAVSGKPRGKPIGIPVKPSSSCC